MKTDEWKIVEDYFDAAHVKAAESLFALGNGVMGGRANFEEHYSGDSLQGNYIGGVYYPDKTRVGWWKNGYPEHFAKVLNAAFWIGVDVWIDGEELDLAKVQILHFYRELDMLHGVLRRRMTVRFENGTEAAVDIERFLPLAHRQTGVVRYSVTPLNRAVEVAFMPYINADVRNTDANYDEKFWEHVATEGDAVQMRTRKSGFEVAWAQCCTLVGTNAEVNTSDKLVSEIHTLAVAQNSTATLYKYVGICSSLNHPAAELITSARAVATEAAVVGFDALAAEQTAAWEQRWRTCDVTIEGDAKAQQGIRFCIFMLLQTYTGGDSRLNIGPKGFTGEKYGGVTYWDTEAYCLPFYLATTGAEVARELLIYRYNQLDKAIENAAQLGFTAGAALYPMVTV
ncbi:MAG: glycoside hydrolase family 65 protein, partial [Alistipes sp.]